MIRNATLKDVDAIIEMSQKFYATTEYPSHTDLDIESIELLAETLIYTGVMLMAELNGEVVGMVGLLIAPNPFNNKKKLACEIVWYVTPDAQGLGAGRALLQAIEPACLAHDVSCIQMVHLNNSPPQAAALYEALGYSHSESSYTKVM